MPQEVQNIANLLTTLRTYLVFLGGPLAALFFTIGGIQYAAAGGSPRRAEQGITTMQYAGLGLIIILFAALLVTIIGKALKADFVLPAGAIISAWPL